MAELTHNPDRIIRSLLLSLSLGTDSADDGAWPVYYSVEPDHPDEVITVYSTIGILQGRSQLTGAHEEKYGIQVRVRGQSEIAGRSKIAAIVNGLDTQTLLKTISVSATSYIVHAMSRKGSILSLGKDQNSNRYLFTVNYTATITEN
jgi:hypothetical protein